MNIWIVSDTHFYHDNMVPFCGRPVDHTEQIVANWNKVVQPNDLVIHLGDVIFGLNKEETLPKIMARLTGKKILCRGNHDPKPGSWYMERGFDFVTDYFVYDYYAFSHAPLTPLPNSAILGEKKAPVFEQVQLNIHGHQHNTPQKSLDDVEATSRFYDYQYYSKNKSKYHLVQIDDELRPFPLGEVIGSWLETRGGDK